MHIKWLSWHAKIKSCHPRLRSVLQLILSDLVRLQAFAACVNVVFYSFGLLLDVDLLFVKKSFMLLHYYACLELTMDVCSSVSNQAWVFNVTSGIVEHLCESSLMSTRLKWWLICSIWDVPRGGWWVRVVASMQYKADVAAVGLQWCRLNFPLFEMRAFRIVKSATAIVASILLCTLIIYTFLGLSHYK